MWKVKTDDGSEYGPVDEGKLLEWARAGRITPGSQISSDGKTWIFAPQKPELGMEWLVEASRGEYFGPFHRDVVQDLLHAKKISPSTRTFRLSGRAEAEAKAESAKLEAELAETRSELKAQEIAHRASDERGDALAAELSSLKSGLESARAEAAESKARDRELVMALEKSGGREAALAAEGEALKAKLKAAESDLAAVSAELAETRSELKAQEAAHRASDERGDALAAALSTAKDGLVSVRTALAGAEARSKRLNGVLAESAGREAMLTKEVAALKDELSAAKDELSAAKEDLARERETCEGLRVEAEKAAEKAARKRADSRLGGLFQDKSLQDLARLELAAQRELSRAKRGHGAPVPEPARLDAIDV